MREMTIQELKALKVGDWVWIDYKLSGNRFYTKKFSQSLGSVFDIVELPCGLDYADYGKIWQAWKNKEQAEAKGEIVEFPCELGQRLYAVYDNKIYEYFSEEINVHEDGRFIFETPTLFPKRLTFGKDIFVNKAEAERRLAELKGELLK